MYISPAERLTLEFYNWETRGRGWFLYNQPVDLEPPFSPFLFHRVGRYEDDGKIPSFLERITSFFSIKQDISPEDDLEQLEPFPQSERDALVYLKIQFPEGFKVDAHSIEHFLVILSSTYSLLSFEIIAVRGCVRFQLVCAVEDYALITIQFKTYFPSCLIEKVEDILEEQFNIPCSYNIREYGLTEEFMRPLGKSKDTSSLSGLLGYFRNIPEWSCFCVQVLFKGAVNPWIRSIVASVQDNKGGPFFPDAPELVAQAKEKVSAPLFACTLRLVLLGKNQELIASYGQLLENALIQGTGSGSNRFSILPLRDDVETYIPDVLMRQSHRTGFLLNLTELSSLLYLPVGNTLVLPLEYISSRTKSSPNLYHGHPFVLGVNKHLGIETSVSIPDEVRLRHLHIVGGTGTGKSTLLENLIVQDIVNGNGVCVLDPHGDLIESILVSIPKERIQDVVVIDPGDGEYPVSFNILKAHSESEKDILSSDLVALFRRFSTSWGDQMNSVFSNAVLAFLEHSDGGTLSDLRRFLVDTQFRRSFLSGVKDPSVLYYWQKEYPLLKTSSIGPILTRLDTFLRPKRIRHMVSQKDSVDFASIIEKKKILLVKLSQGLIGAENSFLLGSLIVSKIHQAALGRQSIEKANRIPFYLYIDEFQHFITPSMESILSGARKYGLGMILAHQDLSQVERQDRELVQSLFSNVGTRISFRVSETDARRLEGTFSFYTSKDLLNLGRGCAIARIDKAENDFNLEVFPPIPHPDTHFKNEILTYSRTKYGRQVSIVEEEIRASFNVPEEDTSLKESSKASSVNPKKEPQKQKDLIAIVPEVPEPVLINTGKEKTLHRYTQMLIKKMAESRGLIATLEKQLPDGGKVDVSLEYKDLLIGCEVCATTTKKWELHNIEKCFSAGYQYVISCSLDVKTLEKIKQNAEKSLSQELKEKVLFLTPPDVVSFLDGLLETQEQSTEKRIKGYRVKVNYESITDLEMKNKREAIAKVVVDSMRKLKKD